MSAAGISMFYASTNAQTAKAEANATLKPGKKVCKVDPIVKTIFCPQ